MSQRKEERFQFRFTDVISIDCDKETWRILWPKLKKFIDNMMEEGKSVEGDSGVNRPKANNLVRSPSPSPEAHTEPDSAASPERTTEK